MQRLVTIALVSLAALTLLVAPAAQAAPLSALSSGSTLNASTSGSSIQPYSAAWASYKVARRRPRPTAPTTITAPAPTPIPVATPTVPVPAPASRWLGFYVPSVPTEVGPLDTLESKVGTTAAVVNFFVADTESFPEGRVANAVNNGSIPMITLEFWSASNGVDTITNGSKDAYLRTFAQKSKAFGKTIYLRPFHEMNGDWYPWNGTVNGNTPAQVVGAWKHVKDIFAAEGATNVKFVWCVNNDSVPNTSVNQVEKYWPGDAYVDFIALDGYNWGNTRTWSSWRTFAQVFGPVYARVAALSPSKPMMVAETSCAEQGGDKAAWIKGMFSSIKTSYPRIKGVVWFNANKENDWRVESSTAAVTAVKTGITAGY